MTDPRDTNETVFTPPARSSGVHTLATFTTGDIVAKRYRIVGLLGAHDRGVVPRSEACERDARRPRALCADGSLCARPDSVRALHRAGRSSREDGGRAPSGAAAGVLGASLGGLTAS